MPYERFFGNSSCLRHALSDSSSMIRLAILYAFALAVLIAITDAGWLPLFAERFHHLPFCDKVVHFTLYGLFALFANLAILSLHRWSVIRSVATGSLIALTIATAEETSNTLVAVRDWSLGDLAANHLGIVVLGIAPFVPRIVRSHKMATELPTNI